MLRKGKVTAPGLVFGVALTAIVISASAGCSSSPGSLASQGAAEADGSEKATANAVVLTGATLLTDGETPRLLLSGAGPLAPTVYTQDDGKRVVVDIPNAVAAPGLEPPRGDGKLFISVGMRSFQELGKPHVRFELTGSAPLETVLGTEPGSTAMAISFLRSEAPSAIAAGAGAKTSAAPAATAPAAPVTTVAETQTASLEEPAPVRVEPLPRTEPSVSSPSPSVAVASAASASVDAGGPLVVARHEASGRSASRLTSVAARQQDGALVVKLGGDGDFGYEAFVLSNPTRYVIDLKGVRNSVPTKAHEIGQGPVARVRVNQFRSGDDGITRVVFDLDQTSDQPTLVATAKGLDVRFGGASTVASTASTVSTASPANTAKPVKAPEMVAAKAPVAGSYETHEVEELAEKAETRSEPAKPMTSAVQVEATQTVASAPVNPEPAPVPPSVSAPAPVMQAAAPAPVTPIRAELVAPPTEVTAAVAPVAATRPKRRPSAEDRALVEAAEALLVQQDAGGRSKDLSNPYESRTLGGGEKQYTGEPITLNLKDADIKDTLQRFSELTGLNIVLDPDVRGTVTVSLTDIPWDQALELILKINGLGFVLEGNVMRIASTGKLQKEEEDKAKLAKTQDLSRPVKTVIKKLSYANVIEAAKTAKNIMSVRGDIFVDDRSNTLIIKELPDYLPTVLDLLNTLDQPTPQVMIEARIVEATRSFSQTLGVDWGFTGRSGASTGNPTGLTFPSDVTTAGGVALANGPTLLALAMRNVLNTFNLDIALSAAESRGLVKIISTPRVQTQTNQAASIQSGFQIPVQTTVNNTTTVLYIDATLRLDVTPQITSEGTVILDIKVQKREPAIGLNVAGGANVPLTTRDAKTKLMVRDGGTAVIGGIFRLTSNDGQSMVPGLWKIPVLGNLFRNKTNRDESDELMIFITPRIMRN